MSLRKHLVVDKANMEILENALGGERIVLC